MLRYLTAGESHGPGLTGIIEGLPSGLRIDSTKIDQDLRRRQGGYGRGERMKIESDQAEFLSGLVDGQTIGAPLALWIANRDWENWKDTKREPKTVPRPGHADLSGLLKYGLEDIQAVIERSSARETAMRVALGSLAKHYLEQFKIDVAGHVIRIGKVLSEPSAAGELSLSEIRIQAASSPVYCIDRRASQGMCRQIDRARLHKDTVGGVFEVVAQGVPVGLGSYVHWDRRLDARLALTLTSIPSVKAAEIGSGVSNAADFGSKIHDQIYYSRNRGYYRLSNRAGGTEGGISNGQRIVVRGYAKPISTLLNPLWSVEVESKKKTKAPYVRSDICFVPALSVVGEAVVALVLADLFSEKFGGDSMKETKLNYKSYLKTLR